MKLTIDFQKEKQDGGNVDYRYSLFPRPKR